MMDRKSLLAIGSIVLAIAVPLFTAAQSDSDIATNPVVKVKIMGYDPRDLLHGHYMQFQYDWNWNTSVSNICTGKNCCLCVEAKEMEPKVNVMECRDAKTTPSCGHIIKGQSWGSSDFYGPPVQYFVDENIGEPLQEFFREMQGKKTFHMGLSLPKSGKAKIEKLYIDGQPLDQYIAQHGAEFKVPEGPAEPPAQ